MQLHTASGAWQLSCTGELGGMPCIREPRLEQAACQPGNGLQVCIIERRDKADVECPGCLRRADADQHGVVLVRGQRLPLQGREARAEALRGRHLPEAAARPRAAVGARARGHHSRRPPPRGARPAPPATERPLQCSLWLAMLKLSALIGSVWGTLAMSLWLARIVMPTLHGPVWDGPAAAYSVICS